jgi:hypothetical protein
MDNAEQIVVGLLEGAQALLEDRLDDLAAKYPELRLTRRQLEDWMRYDPSGRGKYIPWIVRQMAEKKLRMPQEADHLHDQLAAFERLSRIPAFAGNRDIFSYDWPTFDQTMSANLDVRSQSELDREAKQVKKTKEVSQYERQAGVHEINHVGNYALIEIKNAESLAWWAWQAYTKENRNWGKKTIKPPGPGKEVNIQDGYWCIRNPSYGRDYIAKSPTKSFFIVLKNGGPYVAILFQKSGWSQVKDLQNKGISLGIAEEIYPVVADLITGLKGKGVAMNGEAKVFDDLRIVRGEIGPGEEFGDTVDLTGSSIRSLPDNLTFRRDLILQRTKLQRLPSNLTVEGTLDISFSSIIEFGPGLKLGGSLDATNSGIYSLPHDIESYDGDLSISNTKVSQIFVGLEVKGTLRIDGTPITKLPFFKANVVEYSEPLSKAAIKEAFFLQQAEIMKDYFMKQPQVAGLSPQEKEQEWEKFLPRLKHHFATHKSIEKAAGSTFVEANPKTRRPHKHEN